MEGSIKRESNAVSGRFLVHVTQSSCLSPPCLG